MSTLKLKIYMNEEDRKVENFSQEQWDEICIIFEKLVRNIKLELDNIEVEDFDKSQIPYVTMRVDEKEGTEITDDDLIYAIEYLSGEHTENPVYLPDGMHLVNSEIVIEEDKDTSDRDLLDRFNQLVVDIGVE